MTSSSARPHPSPSVLEAFLPDLRSIRERVAAGRLPGVPTGLRTVDKKTGGLQKGVHLLAASPGAGKTTLALQIARNAASQGVAVTYLAMDEGGDRLALKLACGFAGLSATKYLRGEGNLAEIEQAMEAHRDALNLIEIYNGDPVLPADALAMLDARREISGASEGLLIVDFLQAWAARMDSGKGDFRVAVTQIVGQLRQVAMAGRIPILAIAAQNRSGQGEASMASLRESSDLEYTADSIAFLVEEKGESGGARRRVTYSCLKNRWGSLFDVPLIFDAEAGRFGEAGL